MLSDYVYRLYDGLGNCVAQSPDYRTVVAAQRLLRIRYGIVRAFSTSKASRP